MGLKQPKTGIFGKKSIYWALATEKSGFLESIPLIMGV